MRRLLPLAVAVALAPCMVAGAQAGALRLSGSAVALPEPFTRISGVVELDEGRVVIADDAEQRLVVADIGARSIRVIGRQGSGPGEFRGLGALLPRPGGAWLVDFALRRLLPIRADGTFENPIAFPATIMARGSDASGTIYGEAFLPRQAVGVASDSMWILRWNPAQSRIDTLMKYDAFVSASVGGGASRTMRIYHPIDTWTPLPGGEIAILDADAYGLTVYRDARSLRSGNIPWTPVRITDQEKAARRQAMARQRTRVMGQGAGAPASAPPEIAIEFPLNYPPFGGGGLGGRYTQVSPDGRIWVERMRATTDSVPRYDVIDPREGRLTAQVVLPVRSRLVGIGKGAIYVAERDADDVETLKRYADPTQR